MTTQRWSMGGLALSTFAIAVSYGAAFLTSGVPEWASWLLAIAVATSVVSFMALGAARPGRERPLGRLGPVLALTYLMIAGSFLLALALPAEGITDLLWAGLPRRAAIVIYGVGLLPFFVLPMAYARTFDEQTLSEADLARVRAEVRALREREAARVDGAGAGGPPQQHDGVTDVPAHHLSSAGATSATPAATGGGR